MCWPKHVDCTAAEFEEFDVKPTIYSYNELRTATRDFHMDMKLGQGAYGTVYKVGRLLHMHISPFTFIVERCKFSPKISPTYVIVCHYFPYHVMIMQGILSNGNVVAVKQLFVKTTQGIDEFLNEVVLITGMKHRNLVNLKGCCLREHQRLLVYELVDNYDIEKVLLAGELRISFLMISPNSKLRLYNMKSLVGLFVVMVVLKVPYF